MFCWWGFWLAMGFLRDSSLPGAGTRRDFFQGLPPCRILCDYLSGWSFLTSFISLEVGISEKWDLFVCLLFRGFGLTWFGFPAELARTGKLFIGGVFGKKGTTWLERSSFLGITPRPRQCRCQVLTAGLSGTSQESLLRTWSISLHSWNHRGQRAAAQCHLGLTRTQSVSGAYCIWRAREEV